VTVLGNTGTLVKTGYTFAGWNTLADGTGTSYSQNATFSIVANTSLYARWTAIAPTTYTVTYNGNTSTAGVVPVDGSSPYTSGSMVTVLGNTGSPVLSKTGYQFAGWNTAADGSGTSYVGGNTFNIAANTTLYAQWIIGGISLVYSAGTGGSGTAPASSGTYYTAYSPQPVVGNTGSFSNGSKVFGGWNTFAFGFGTTYLTGSEITMPGGVVGSTVTLHAQWIDPATTYTLTYNAGTGGAGTAPASPTTYSSKEPVTILANTGPYTNSGSAGTFYGWNTAINGSGTSYPAGSTLTMIANTTLYAQWVTSPQYTVTYDANGATSGSVPDPAIYPGGVQVPIVGQGTLKRPGFTFMGWNGSPTGAGSLYAPGYAFASKTVTLYALWAPGSTIRNCGGYNTGSGSGATSITIFYPYATIVQSSDTITIYTTALLGTTAANYGSGAAPLGAISIASKTVITQTNIQTNVNTSYLTSANDYNYAKTITNGVDSTYWPSGATVSSITYSSFSPTNSNSMPTYSISTKTSFSTGNGGLSTNFLNQSFIMNFSDSTNTQIYNSPNYTFYTANSGTTWTNAPRTIYPYALIVPNSDNALITITIVPSTGPQYVYPPLPNYTIEYDGNGNTSAGGSLPAPQYMDPYVSGTMSISLRTGAGGGVNGALLKTGSTFSGWNTAANGSGTNYAAGAIYNGGASLKLYAKWV